jgi:hypothetical protein
MKPFHHAHLEVTADVAPGQTPDEVLDDLKRFAIDKLRETRDKPFTVRTSTRSLTLAETASSREEWKLGDV